MFFNIPKKIIMPNTPNTLKERKQKIIQVINQQDEWIDDFEDMIDFIIQKRMEERQGTSDSTLRKYVKPLKEKTDLEEIIASQKGSYEAFITGCKKHNFFQEISEEEFIRQLIEMS